MDAGLEEEQLALVPGQNAQRLKLDAKGEGAELEGQLPLGVELAIEGAEGDEAVLDALDAAVLLARQL